jgi:hypothetical protein
MGILGFRLPKPVGYHTKTFRCIPSFHVTINQGLTGGDKNLNAGRKSSKNAAPIRDISPEVIAAEAIATSMWTLPEIAKRSVPPIQHVIGAQQPQIVKRVHHWNSHTSAS